MNENKKKVLQILVLLLISITPLSIVTGCSAGSCIKCGDDDTRLLCYSKKTDSAGMEYTSCVGPAGCTGCGLNTKCWPTECVKVNGVTREGELSGCVTFYDGFGCINNSDAKSSGSYSSTVSCGCVPCAGSKYNEEVTDNGPYANQSDSCLCISCNKEARIPIGRNDSVPRAFTNGCWCGE